MENNDKIVGNRTNYEFCYEISAEAGLAYDPATGKDATAWVKYSTDLPHLTEEEYKTLHEESILHDISYNTGIQSEHLRPISVEEYYEHNDPEEGDD
ncbi:hypothetical protein D1872_90130 [compost metagenome]